MRLVQLLAPVLGAVVSAAVLVGCSSVPAPAATPSAPATVVVTVTVPAQPTRTLREFPALPPAPPVEQWTKMGNTFVETVDLEMSTELMNNDYAFPSTDEVRALGYLICSRERSGEATSDVNQSVAQMLNYTGPGGATGLVLTAHRYCLDVIKLPGS